MTLVIAVMSHKCIWMCADRRLSSTKLLGTKLMRLETIDSTGVFSYAGVGAKLYSQPFEVSDWLRRTLRECKCTLNEALNIVAEEATRQSIHRLLPAGHIFMYAGFENGAPVIETIATPNFATKTIPMRPGAAQIVIPNHSQSFNRHRFVLERVGAISHFAIGCGATHLTRHMFSGIKKYVDQLGTRSGSVAAVSGRLAEAVRLVSRSIPNEVSAESICAAVQADKTGGYRAYDANGKSSCNDVFIPSISNGMDLGTIFEAIVPVIAEYFQKHREAIAAGEPQPASPTERMDEALRAQAENFKRRPKF